MYSQHLLTTLLILFTTLTGSVFAADRVGDFSLLDQEGYFHQMSWYDNNKAVALMVHARHDDEVKAKLPAFMKLKAAYEKKGIKLFMINSSGLENREEIKADLASMGISIPVLMDDAKVISSSLGITQTSEVFVLDPKSFKLLFKGPVGEQLSEAFDSIIADKNIHVSERTGFGSPVLYPLRAAYRNHAPSYENEIGPIIAENCATCHRVGGIAPFAFDSYTMVKGWSQMIREVLMTKRMPPGQIDSHVGEFINDMVLTDEKVQKVIYWIEAGSPNDGESDPLAQLVWPETEWAFGKPDYIIEIPEQEIPATGVLDYYNVMVDLDIKKDRWVRASQYIPGDRTVLHHTLHSLIPPGATSGGALLGGEPDRPDIALYIPGQAPRMEPPNTGGLLKAGTKIAMQMHYTTTGKASVDASRIGLWFYPEDFVPEERMTGQCACHFTPTWVNIPPMDPDYEMTQSFTIEKDAKLFSLTPHMHFRGKRMRFYADYPDGTSEELINIANYNYSWQLAYTYKQPKFVPAGTIITAIGAFDNSEQNKMNPDPFRSVPWGLQSWDEMFFGAADWKYIDQSLN